MSGLSFFTNIICPLIGTLLCLMMWITPFQAVMKARQDKTLGTLNPTPFAIAIVNCIGWVMYSVVQKDYFIFFANAPGIVLGVFYAITSLVLLALTNINKPLPIESQILETALVGGSFAYSLLVLIVGIVLPSSQANLGRLLVAIFATCCTIMYYASPLTTMYTVITTKDSSTLHPPMLFANLANSTMWLIYGVFALHDPFVYGPNGVGATLAGLQLTLSLVYSRKKTDKENLLDDQHVGSDHAQKTGSGTGSDKGSEKGGRNCSHESFSIDHA